MVQVIMYERNRYYRYDIKMYKKNCVAFHFLMKGGAIGNSLYQSASDLTEPSTAASKPEIVNRSVDRRKTDVNRQVVGYSIVEKEERTRTFGRFENMSEMSNKFLIWTKIIWNLRINGTHALCLLLSNQFLQKITVPQMYIWTTCASTSLKLRTMTCCTELEKNNFIQSWKKITLD